MYNLKKKKGTQLTVSKDLVFFHLMRFHFVWVPLSFTKGMGVGMPSGQLSGILREEQEESSGECNFGGDKAK